MGAEKLLGHWEEFSREGDFEAFVTAMGYSPERREVFRNQKLVMSYEKVGDKWQTSVSLTNATTPIIRTYSMGEPYDTVTLDGLAVTVVVTENENGITEKVHFKNELEGTVVTITRYINDQGLLVTEKVCNGHVLKVFFKPF